MVYLTKPIFIGGSGRSGTTLLFDLLVSNSENCFSFGLLESKFIVGPDGLVDLYHAMSKNYSPGRATNAISRFTKLMTRLKKGEIYVNDGLNLYYNDPKKYDEICNEFYQKLGTSNFAYYLNEDEFFNEVRSFITNLIINHKDFDQSSRFVEKTPHNFLHIHFLKKIFPDLKFIHIVRDPRAVSLSLTKQKWAPNAYVDACYWLAKVYDAFLDQSGINSLRISNFLEIKLESLASKEVLATKNLIRSFLEIEHFEFDPKKINEQKITYWKNQISRENLRKGNFVLKKYIKYFNYI